mgnify:CR=1 FL=1
MCLFFFQAEDGIRDLVRSRGLGDVYKRQRSKDGKGPYLLGPAARVSLCADQLHPVARALLEELSLIHI